MAQPVRQPVGKGAGGSAATAAKNAATQAKKAAERTRKADVRAQRQGGALPPSAPTPLPLTPVPPVGDPQQPPGDVTTQPVYPPGYIPPVRDPQVPTPLPPTPAPPAAGGGTASQDGWRDQQQAPNYDPTIAQGWQPPGQGSPPIAYLQGYAQPGNPVQGAYPGTRPAPEQIQKYQAQQSQTTPQVQMGVDQSGAPSYLSSFAPTTGTSNQSVFSGGGQTPGSSVGSALSQAGAGGGPALAGGTPGWGGYAPLKAPPPTPSWDQWRNMDSFQQAAFRTLASEAEPYTQTIDRTRHQWADQGVFAQPDTSQLAAHNFTARDKMQSDNTSEMFGQKPDEYWNAEGRTWATSNQPNVKQQT